MINWSILYVLAWCVYGMQGGFIPRGVFFAKVICLVLLLISTYHFVIVNLKFHLPRYFIGLNVLLGMFFFYGSLSLVGITTHPLSEEYLKSILISLLPIYSFFFFSKREMITEKNIYIFIVILFVFAFLKFYGVMYSFSLLSRFGDVDFTNNAGYLFLPLLAASVFLYKKKFIQYSALCICLIFAIESSKRGAIIAGIVALVYFFANELRGKSLRIKIGVILLFSVLCSVGYATFDKHVSESFAFQRKILYLQEGSGRNHLYQMLLNHFFYETDRSQFLFGSGANATLSISSLYAHNDWLEIAINQGVFGLMIYFFYWIMFFRECSSKSYTPYARLAMQLLFIIYFMKTFFSMSYNDMTVGATLVLGYCLAQEKKNEQIIYSI